MHIRSEQVRFFVAIFYSLEERTKSDFSRLLDCRVLDRAINQGIKQGLFPDWSIEEFGFDPLFSTLDGLRALLAKAQFSLLIRLDGTNFKYHLDQISGDALGRLIQDERFTLDEVREIAEKLQPIIDEKLRKHEEFLAGRT